MRILLVIALTGLTGLAYPDAFLFDMGDDKSTVMKGFTRVTRKDLYDAKKGFGWDSAAGMQAYVKAYDKPVENTSRGIAEPPPIYTNALTEDCLVGSEKRTFQLDLPAGEYDIFILCGSSYFRNNQFHDFQVRVNAQSQRVQIEAGYQFRRLRFRAKTDGKPLRINFEPRSKWVLNAIMVWNAADAARVEKQVRELEQSLDGLPPEEWAKWRRDPLPPTTPFPEMSVAPRDRGAGFVIFHKPYVECVYPNTNPRVHEINATLRSFATPGEYEPLTFSVRALAPLENARVKALAIGPVAAETIDVRHVRYMRARPNYRTYHRYHIVPDALERFDALNIPEGETQRFWLTVRVPPDAKPGQYHGAVQFSAAREGGREVTVEIPVELRVLDIKLREDPEKIYGMYYRDPLDRWRHPADDVSKEYFWRKSELEHADMAAHGIRNVTLTANCSPANEKGEFEADWMTLKAKLEMARKYNFRGPYATSINTGGVYKKYMGELYGSHLRNIKMPPPEFFAEMKRMVAFIEAERKKYGWPEFLYYPIDEPGVSETAVGFMTELLKAIRETGARTYVTADPTKAQFAPLRPYVSVWCTQPFLPDRETVLADMAAHDVEYWCYPNHVNGENDHTPVAGARMTYGFGFWRSGFKTLIPWIYSYSCGDPWNYLDGPSMDFFNRHEPDGTPVPVAQWEAYREGYDDYRYVYTLESMIREARAAGRDKAADEAAAALKSVWDAIEVQAKYKYDDLWSPEEFDVQRWIIARAILKLEGKE